MQGLRRVWGYDPAERTAGVDGPPGPRCRDQCPVAVAGPLPRRWRGPSCRRRAARLPCTLRRPTLDRKNAPQNAQTRRERRAAENRDRFDAAREERRNRAAGRTGGSGGSGRPGGSSLGLITVVALAAGAVLVGVLVFTQLNKGGGSADEFIDPGVNYPASIVDGKALGSTDAPVVMEVFEDYQCPFCGKHSLTVEPVLVARYVNNGTLRIEHRDLAFLGNRTDADESVLAASAATCALKQDRYFQASAWIYANQAGENRGGFRRERLDAIVEAAGLDMTAYTACMADPATVADVKAKTLEIMGLGVDSTPTIRLNGGQLLTGLSVDQMGQAIEAAAAAASASPTP